MGSKSVSLLVSKCFPVCPRNRTPDLLVNQYTPRFNFFQYGMDQPSYCPVLNIGKLNGM
jgi:hypothetical protein